MITIRNRNWTHALYSGARLFANTAQINLKREYPALFQLVHPRDQREVESADCDAKTVLSWKCPNKEDHEWEMSIQEAIHYYNRNIRHSSNPF